MKVQLWNCVLGLLFMPAGAILTEWKADQLPRSTSFVRINSSTEISCSTSLSEPLGLYLKRHFLDGANIVYLALDKGRITKTTKMAEFEDRIRVSAGPQVQQGHSFTLQLSLLRVEDTDLYYCSWSYFEDYTSGELSCNGTVIIVGETNPAEACESTAMDLIIICLTTTILSAIVILGIGALIFRCTRFEKIFRPGRGVKPPTASRHQLVAPEQPVQHDPYLITALSPRALGASRGFTAEPMTL